jgi:hypothetical protein
MRRVDPSYFKQPQIVSSHVTVLSVPPERDNYILPRMSLAFLRTSSLAVCADLIYRSVL